eukprot:GHVT01033909.1.p1 GENE.GHVT01033909.1~~GHVT01033909.1.p1  ORF type:complete len:116 (-),score=22.91 GHVT01033909.1:283-630(-)
MGRRGVKDGVEAKPASAAAAPQAGENSKTSAQGQPGPVCKSDAVGEFLAPLAAVAMEKKIFASSRKFGAIGRRSGALQNLQAAGLDASRTKVMMKNSSAERRECRPSRSETRRRP